jgi:P-type Ca2+ transporter type 2C
MQVTRSGPVENFEPHQLQTAAVLEHVQVDFATGLSTTEVKRRHSEYGPNELTGTSTRSLWRILWDQLTDTMVVVLLAAAAISLAMRDFKSAIAISAIVILNAVLGFVQEYRAERAIAALKKLASPNPKVRRDGWLQQVPMQDLVPGDIVSFEAGDLVPADCRLLQTETLRTEEAALTGEAEPVAKDAGRVLDERTPLSERCNMAYLGTTVCQGHAVAVVVRTAMQTELGRIAGMLQTVERVQTPLQRRLDRFGRSMALIAVGLVAIIFVLGMLRGEEIKRMFLTAISMAVAVVPEGLPAVVTIALALGARRMLKRDALIRRLPAVEALGSITVICSDKTGTLTQNRVVVTDIVTGIDEATVIEKHLPTNKLKFALLLLGGALCNDASFKSKNGAGPETTGDPTEAALIVAADRAGLYEPKAILPRVREVPFNPERRRMTTVHLLPPPMQRLPDAVRTALQVVSKHDRFIAFTKGSVEGLVQLCNRYLPGDHTAQLTAGLRSQIEVASNQLAKQGKRVLGIAFRSLSALPPNSELEQDLVFLGMIALTDPPRKGVKEAVQTCQLAGIRPLMITGDHPLTAGQIGHELGFAGRVLNGTDLERMSIQELERTSDDISICARAVPEQKLKIVQALQSHGHIVAMTGDGVNDAPALKKADIGVAMGITGTDVAKQAADMVLLDDNFSTIVAAIEEGRAIYDNVRKFIRYVLAGNVGEILVMLFGPILGLPLALLPLQILWINLVSDGVNGLALSVEPPERNTMRRPPYPPEQSILGQGIGIHILWVGSLIGLLPLCIGWFYWQQKNPAWQTMLFAVLAFGQIFQTLAARSWYESSFACSFRSQFVVIGSLALTVASTLAIIYLPFMQDVFGTTPLTPGHLLASLILSSSAFWAIEFEKLIKRRRRKSVS